MNLLPQKNMPLMPLVCSALYPTQIDNPHVFGTLHTNSLAT